MSAPRIQGGVIVTAEIQGLGELIGQLEQAGVKCRRAVANYMQRAGKEILVMAQETYVPIDTGALHDSAHTVLEFESDAVQVSVIFGPSLAERLARGGFSEGEYAWIVHEYGTDGAGANSKYLEIPAEIWLQANEQDSWQEMTDEIFG